jgi:16S rRNA (guanine966-N2)-methyltransferase
MNAARAGAGSVRIIGGRWRGSKLPVPAVEGLRPTSDRARETLFNWLQPVLPGARVLDLFAGTGVLGLEAVSRGAGEAVLVERDARACAALRDSAARLQAGQGDAVRIACMDALAFLADAAPGTFDLAFVDPPFAAEAWDAVLGPLSRVLAPSAWLYVESPPQRSIALPPDWRLHRDGRTRDAAHRLYRRTT